MTDSILTSLVYCLVNKVRFSHNGPKTTEDLYGLAPTSLDAVYRGLQAELKDTETPGLIKPKATAATIKLQHMLAVVGEVYNYKEAQRNEQIEKATRAAQNAKIDEIIAAKQDEALTSLSLEDLLKLKQG